MLIPVLLSPTVFEAQIPGPQILSDADIPTVFLYEEEVLGIKLGITLPWVQEFIWHLSIIVRSEARNLREFSFNHTEFIRTELFEEIPDKKLACKLAEYTLRTYPDWKERHVKIPTIEETRKTSREQFCSNCDIGWLEQEIMSEDGAKVERVERTFVCPLDCDAFHSNMITSFVDQIDMNIEVLNRYWKAFKASRDSQIVLPLLNDVSKIQFPSSYDESVSSALEVLGIKR